MEKPAAKKAKHTSARDQLPSLLTELNGGKPLDLSVLAAIQAPVPDTKPAEDSASAPRKDPLYYDEHKATILNIFSEHVGKSPEIVVGNAIRLAFEEFDREGAIWEKIDKNIYSGKERDEWLGFPQNRHIEGPEPDGKVWLAMFLGEKRADEALEGILTINDEEADSKDLDRQMTEKVVWDLLKDEALKLSLVDLLANTLFYVRSEAQKMTDKDGLKNLLRFSVLYGLDGVMKDVLNGRYGEASGIDVDTILPMSVNEIQQQYGGMRIYMPAYAMGAVLGHENIVDIILKELGGEFDAPQGIQRSNDGDVALLDNQSLPANVLLWVFMKNMPDMIKCLVVNHGFQFRWIGDRQFEFIYHRIFEAPEFESNPKWTDIDENDVIWAGSRQDRCRMRKNAVYPKQMEMLDHIISLGFPFSLFFDDPSEHGTAIETKEQWKSYYAGLSVKARRKIYGACCEYNSAQENRRDRLKVHDFFRKLKARWDGQESVQPAHLPEFESLDPRWKKKEQETNGEREDEDEESDYYSYDSD